MSSRFGSSFLLLDGGISTFLLTTLIQTSLKASTKAGSYHKSFSFLRFSPKLGMFETFSNTLKYCCNLADAIDESTLLFRYENDWRTFYIFIFKYFGPQLEYFIGGGMNVNE